MYCSYLTPKASIRQVGAAGLGSIVTAAIPAGEAVAAFGGWVASAEQFAQLEASTQGLSIQIDDDLFLVAPVGSDGDRVNHSCEPNCGMRGGNVVVAMRDIAVGEQLTFDYAMSDGSSYDEFECNCGAATCRGKVTGRDWMEPDLQRRYRGFFSPYLARRISMLVSAGAERRAFSY